MLVRAFWEDDDDGYFQGGGGVLSECDNIGDPVSFFPHEGLGVNENLPYEEVAVEIQYRQLKKFRNKEVASVKDLWRDHLVEVEI